MPREEPRTRPTRGFPVFGRHRRTVQTTWRRRFNGRENLSIRTRTDAFRDIYRAGRETSDRGFHTDLSPSGASFVSDACRQNVIVYVGATGGRGAKQIRELGAPQIFVPFLPEYSILIHYFSAGVI